MRARRSHKDEAAEHRMAVSLTKLQGDRALFALADMHMRDWCGNFGGEPSDATEKLALRCSLEPAASKLLMQLMEMPDGDKRAMAHRLWSANRNVVAPSKPELVDALRKAQDTLLAAANILAKAGWENMAALCREDHTAVRVVCAALVMETSAPGAEDAGAELDSEAL